MGVAAEATFTVALDVLVTVAKAVEPIGRKGDEDVLKRVRFVATRDLLHVIATDGTRSAVGMVAIDPDSDSRGPRVAEDDGTFTLDADPAEVRQIVSRFTKGASSKRDAPRRTLRMHWTDRMLRLTDITEQQSTLDLDREDVKSPDVAEVPARDLGVLVSPPSADYPDVLDAVQKAAAGVGASTQAKSLVTYPPALGGLLSHLPSKADVAVDATGSDASHGFVVVCGAWFIATLPSRADSDSLARRRRARMLLLHRLLGTDMPDDLPDDDEDLDDIDDQDDDDQDDEDGDDQGEQD